MLADESNFMPELKKMKWTGTLSNNTFIADLVLTVDSKESFSFNEPSGIGNQKIRAVIKRPRMMKSREGFKPLTWISVGIPLHFDSSLLMSWNVHSV